MKHLSLLLILLLAVPHGNTLSAMEESDSKTETTSHAEQATEPSSEMSIEEIRKTTDSLFTDLRESLRIVGLNLYEQLMQRVHTGTTNALQELIKSHPNKGELETLLAIFCNTYKTASEAIGYREAENLHQISPETLIGENDPGRAALSSQFSAALTELQAGNFNLAIKSEKQRCAKNIYTCSKYICSLLSEIPECATTIKKLASIAKLDLPTFSPSSGAAAGSAETTLTSPSTAATTPSSFLDKIGLSAYKGSTELLLPMDSVTAPLVTVSDSETPFPVQYEDYRLHFPIDTYEKKLNSIKKIVSCFPESGLPVFLEEILTTMRDAILTPGKAFFAQSTSGNSSSEILNDVKTRGSLIKPQEIITFTLNENHKFNLIKLHTELTIDLGKDVSLNSAEENSRIIMGLILYYRTLWAAAAEAFDSSEKSGKFVIIGIFDALLNTCREKASAALAAIRKAIKEVPLSASCYNLSKKEAKMESAIHTLSNIRPTLDNLEALSEEINPYIQISEDYLAAAKAACELEKYERALQSADEALCEIVRSAHASVKKPFMPREIQRELARVITEAKTLLQEIDGLKVTLTTSSPDKLERELVDATDKLTPQINSVREKRDKAVDEFGKYERALQSALSALCESDKALREIIRSAHASVKKPLMPQKIGRELDTVIIEAEALLQEIDGLKVTLTTSSPDKLEREFVDATDKLTPRINSVQERLDAAQVRYGAYEPLITATLDLAKAFATKEIPAAPSHTASTPGANLFEQHARNFKKAATPLTETLKAHIITGENTQAELTKMLHTAHELSAQCDNAIEGAKAMTRYYKQHPEMSSFDDQIRDLEYRISQTLRGTTGKKGPTLVAISALAEKAERALRTAQKNHAQLANTTLFEAYTDNLTELLDTYCTATSTALTQSTRLMALIESYGQVRVSIGKLAVEVTETLAQAEKHFSGAAPEHDATTRAEIEARLKELQKAFLVAITAEADFNEQLLAQQETIRALLGKHLTSAEEFNATGIKARLFEQITAQKDAIKDFRRDKSFANPEDRLTQEQRECIAQKLRTLDDLKNSIKSLDAQTLIAGEGRLCEEIRAHSVESIREASEPTSESKASN